MKAGLMFIGIALIALGLITLVYQGVTYTTKREGRRSRSSENHRAKREDDPAVPRPWGASHWQVASS